MPGADPVPVALGVLIVVAALTRTRVGADPLTGAGLDAARAAR